MTREEQSFNAAKEFWLVKDELCDVATFQKGVKWADEHPFWHNAETDSPKIEGRYLIRAYNGYISICDYKNGLWRVLGYQSDVKYWMELPKFNDEVE